MISLTPYLLAIENDDDRIFIAGLYEAYGKEMKVFARKIVGEHLADDVLHNAFLKLIQNIDKLKEVEPDRRRAYTYVVTRNCANDVLRKEGKYVDLDDEYLEIISEHVPTAVDKIVDEEGYKYLISCIRNLREPYREVCEMKYVLHMKEREIAAALGLTEKNVNSRIYRGRQILKKMVREGYGRDQ